MATVKKANVPPTHPSVWVGLAVATIGLLMAVYAYTGARVFDITFAYIAVAGAVLALVGILVAAWGRSIMAARASRSRRATMQADALAISKPVELELPESRRSSEDEPTIAASREKKRFSFSLPKRAKPEKKDKASGESVFAFRRQPAAPAEPEPAVAAEMVQLVAGNNEPVRVTLRCPQCSTTFTTEGQRPFRAACTSCGFVADV